MDELYHHGILGQRWGVRRFQNADGSLTSAGRKRVSKLENKYSKLTGTDLKKKKSGEEESRMITAKSKKAKSIKDLSTEELREKTNRLNAERDYINAKRDVTKLTAKQVSKGRKIANKVIKEVITPAAIDIGKQASKSLMAKYGNKAFKFEGELKLHSNNKKK